MPATTDFPAGTMLFNSESIEVLRDDFARGRLRFALFDFDGTLSLIRTGWQDVMIPMMLEYLTATPDAEDEAALTSVVREYVDTLTGKQTVYQMIRLAEEVKQRGGQALDPLEYKHEYLRRLWDVVAYRVEGLDDGSIDPEELLVPGVTGLLAELRERGITCYLASGTDHPCVENEARALHVTDWFDGGIYGALDDYRQFSKAKVIQGIIAEHGLHGPELVGFGDGYVEVENVVEVGGIAVGAATDEANRAGLDTWKRNRLAGAGAQVIVPDFREHRRLLSWLTAEE